MLSINKPFNSCCSQGSRWTLQATLMNGRVDFLDWTIKPEQMQTIIPFFGLIFLVLFDVVFYPLLAKVGIRKPLQKFTLSGLLAIVAFIVAALLEIKIFVRMSIAALINNTTFKTPPTNTSSEPLHRIDLFSTRDICFITEHSAY